MKPDEGEMSLNEDHSTQNEKKNRKSFGGIHPNKRMRVDMEEVDVEPCDLFVDLGMLVVEGRIPNPGHARGYGEGPHCPPLVMGQRQHQCETRDIKCARYETFRKRMMLLWKNNIPMSIEVVLCPDCPHGANISQKTEACPAPEPTYELLEQWIIHMTPRRFPEGTVPAKSLLQAVRSFLHFSQVSAWLSSSSGKYPQNVMYRICVPGEAFSNKFSKLPTDHTFPVANVGRNNSMKVVVKHLPRCESVPRVLCRRKHGTQDEVEASCSYSTSQQQERNKLNMACALSPPSYQSERRSREDLRRCLAANIHKKEGDGLLGDCLLDPPQSLEMYPKRYQSPSRSGSPVMETPEHLMFGSSRESSRLAWTRSDSRERKLSQPSMSSTKKGAAPLESEDEDETEVLDYPIVENPTIEEPKTSSPKLTKSDSVFQKNYFHLEESPLNRTKDLGSHSQQSSLYFALTPKETEEILTVLRQTTPSWASSRSKSTSRKYWNVSNEPSTSSTTTSQLDSVKTNIDTEPVPVESRIVEDDVVDTAVCDTLEFMNCQNNCKMDGQEDNSLNVSLMSIDDNSCGEFDENTFPVDQLVLDNGEIDWDEFKKVSQNCDTECRNQILQQLLTKHGLSAHSKALSSQAKEAILRLVPSLKDKAQFRRSLDSATSMVFHTRTGLPLTSSPAPIRRGTRFDFDSSLTSVAAIKKALFVSDSQREEDREKTHCYLLSSSAPAATCGLLGNFEESVLNGRLEPVSTVEGFTAEIGASGSFLTKHLTLPVTVFFYTFSDNDKVSSPYLGHINLGKKRYYVPPSGTIQITLFNPHMTVVKMFVVRYDLSTIPPNCQTFLRQRTLFMPVGADENSIESQKWLRYLIHLRLASSKSGRLYLHTDVRMVIYRQSDVDAATSLSKGAYELRSFTHGPQNPPYSTIS